MSRHQIRPATLKDARAVAEIHVAAWHAVYEGLLSASASAATSVDKRLAFWREAIELAEPQTLIATEGDRVVGFVAFDRSRDKGTPPTTGEICAIGATPSHWSTGVGLALWDAARDALIEEGCTKVTLWVPLRNERALRFFELAGFRREMSTAKTVDLGGVRVEEIRLQRMLA
ncbi:MAG: GNAT family N-acetyltransferase [Rhizobacter sp.]|nr:GNAT family N-acetyltransferase [Rhizobacter sp.]